MLRASRTPVTDVLRHFSTRGVDVTFLVPTETGYGKSIMDATAPVRDFLRDHSVHDYDSQPQGPDAKVLYPAVFVMANSLRETTASLYRPLTKSGDPRIWFRGLKEYCSPSDLLGLVSFDGQLYVFDLSDPSVIDSIEHGGTAAKILDQAAAVELAVASELLARLRNIARMGFVDTLVPGDTGIGMTLEYLLGIPPNSSRTPDYKGIEIKATRQGGRRAANRVNLFSQVPDWRNSAMSARELLSSYGYDRDGRWQLYCTVSAYRPNSQGLYFSVDEEAGLLRSRSVCPGDLRHDSAALRSVDEDRSLFSDTSIVAGLIREVNCWDTGLLRQRLEDKHAETFWVKADCKVVDGVERFRYTSVTHTRKPVSSVLSSLLADGVVTMDYTLSERGASVHDHGYLFKMHPDNWPMLFPEPIHYELVDF